MAIAMALTAVSGAIGAYSQYQQGKAEQANHEYNAKLAENQAEQGQDEARENARRGWKNNEEQLASIRARSASSGSVSNVGSALAVMGDISAELELGVQDAYRGAQIHRTSLLKSAENSRLQGRAAAKSGRLMALGSLVGTAAKLKTNIGTYKKTGLLAKDKATYNRYKSNLQGYGSSIKSSYKKLRNPGSLMSNYTPV